MAGRSPYRNSAAAGQSSRRLCVYNGGFITQKRVRRILQLAGYQVSLGLPRSGDLVGVWGQSPTSHRGRAVARRRGANLLFVEDAFLRSVRPGREGDLPIGLHLDRNGVHFDPSTISDLERILSCAPLDDAVLLERARAGIRALRFHKLSKYNMFDFSLKPPASGYVLVVDQTARDASVRASGADRETFLGMLRAARAEHPDKRILIKTHPETIRGLRGGHYQADDLDEACSFCADPISPHDLLSKASAVYTVSSQLGFEAILAGHRPVVFGQPFYIGWGLTDDRKPLARRTRKLSVDQLFAGAMLIYPVWYDSYEDQLCTFEDVVPTLAAQARAWRDDHQGWLASGMRLWKRRPLQKVFGGNRQVVFNDHPNAADRAKQQGRRHMVWAGKAVAFPEAVRVEDGFLRSTGLGAQLVPPLSLVLDDLGIYFDPSKPSRLEALINEATALPGDAVARAEALIAQIVAAGLSKYNLQAQALPALPEGRRILVPGQVEDDASIRLGTTEIKTNEALLKETRRLNPDAVILYKPHPDVEAGLRQGAVAAPLDYADLVIAQTDPVAAIMATDEVWTMTSTLGFEGLLRGAKVVCLGTPFYAGWGLTTDLGPACPRRHGRPSISQFVHSVLIDYPRYFDPTSGLACPPEVVINRLKTGQIPRPSPANRALAKLQGVFASYAHLWR